MMLRYFLLITNILPFITFAQYEIAGHIMNPDSIPVKSITVKLFRQGEITSFKTVLTDTKGFFKFSISNSGSYAIGIQSFFYKEITLENIMLTQKDPLKRIGPVLLDPIVTSLNGVIVSVAKQPIEFKDDYLVYDPGADATAGTRPVSEILNRIPGITIDAQNQIMAKGQESVQILVNSRLIRSSPADFLAQLNTDEVERIEVYDNASRFSYIKSAVIINIVLKKQQQKKLWNAIINTNTLPKLNPAFDASFSFGKQRIYARLSHDILIMRSEGYHQRKTGTLTFYQDFNNRLQHTMTSGRFGWDYFIDSSRTLSAEWNYTRHNDKLNALTGINSPAGIIQNHIQSSPIEKELGGWIIIKKDNKQKGYKMFETGFTHFSLSNNRNIPALQLEEEREMNNYSFGWKGEWQENRNKLKLLNGISGQLTRIKDRIDTPGIANRLHSRFNNNSITSYHQLGRDFKNWNVSAGTAIDYILLQLNNTGKAGFRYQDIFINPSLKINKIIGQVKTSLSYNRKYILPGTHLMFGQYNQYEFGRTETGNYALRPAVQDMVKFSFSKNKKYTVLWELYYDFTKNPFITLYSVYGDFIIGRPENLRSRESIGSLFSFTLAPASFFSFTFNMDGRLNKNETTETDFIANSRTWSVSSTLINRFTLDKKLNLSFNASLNNLRTSLYRTMDAFMVYTLQGNYKINKKMNLSFGINDIANNMQFGYKGKLAPGFYESGFIKNKFRNISLTIRYQLMNSQTMEKKTETLKSFISE